MCSKSKLHSPVINSDASIAFETTIVIRKFTYCHPEPAKTAKDLPYRKTPLKGNSVIISVKVRSLLVSASRDDMYGVLPRLAR
jgi:hypothetical protein